MKLCPSYMAMGMTYDEFWNRNTKVHKAFREAFEIRSQHAEWERHRQGAYFLNALQVALQGFNKDKSKKIRYPERPWPLTEKEAELQKAEEERRGYEQALARRRAEIERARLRKLEQMEVSGDGDD